MKTYLRSGSIIIAALSIALVGCDRPTASNPNPQTAASNTGAQTSNAPTTGTPTRNQYPPEIVKIFMDECTKDGDAVMTEICQCSINEFQNQYTLDEFVKASEAPEGSPEQRNIEKVAENCANKVTAN